MKAYARNIGGESCNCCSIEPLLPHRGRTPDELFAITSTVLADSIVAAAKNDEHARRLMTIVMSKIDERWMLRATTSQR